MLSSVKWKIRIAAAELFAQIAGDQFAVEAAILNEDFVGLGAGDDDTRHIDSRHVRLQSLGIAYGAQLLGRQLDANAAQEVVVRMVSGEREDKIVFHSYCAGGRVDYHAI